MPFPKTKRVIYKKNPLIEVICQLRFSSILKIDAEVPAEFQERIRKDFPKFSEKKEFRIDIPAGVEDELPPEVIGRLIQSTSGKNNYEFISDDELWKINLTRTFVALTTKKYHQWEEFISKLQAPFEAVNEIYSPSKFSRIGLRYINVIHRSNLGIDDISWSELIEPYILGILSSDDIAKHVQSFQNKYEILLSDQESFVRMRTKFVKPKNNQELCFQIDNDFIHERDIKSNAIIDKLDYLRKRGSRCFRWSIKDRLHEALEPEDL